MSLSVAALIALGLALAAVIVAGLILRRREPARPYRDEACDVCLTVIGREPYHTIVDRGPRLADAMPGVESAVAASRHARCCPGDCVQRDRHAA